MTELFDGSYPPEVLHPTPPPVPPTGATPGTPGAWTPDGATPPANLLAANALGLDLGTAWTDGAYVVLGNGDHAYWDGAAFVAGEAPAADLGVFITTPADGATVLPLHDIRGEAAPGTVVHLWVWDQDVSADWRDLGRTATADESGSFLFTGDEPMVEGTVSWKVLDDEGDESPVVTVQVVDPNNDEPVPEDEVDEVDE